MPLQFHWYLFLFHSSLHLFSIFEMATDAILDFKIFAIFVKNSNYHSLLCPHAKLGEVRTVCSPVTAYFRFSKWQPSAILYVYIFGIFVKKSHFRLFLCPPAKFGADRATPAVLLHTFNFQNSSCSPSWIWYDVISDHPQLVFDGPNILVKLHVDRFYTLQDITIFILGPFGLKFWYCHNPQNDRPWTKTRRMSHKPWKSIHGFDLGACPRKI